MRNLNTITSEFVGRISVAVWIGRISDESAREALAAFAEACRRMERFDPEDTYETILAEYQHRREGQDLCS
jgi:hypothetical protein